MQQLPERVPLPRRRVVHRDAGAHHRRARPARAPRIPAADHRGRVPRRPDQGRRRRTPSAPTSTCSSASSCRPARSPRSCYTDGGPVVLAVNSHRRRPHDAGAVMTRATRSIFDEPRTTSPPGAVGRARPAGSSTCRPTPRAPTRLAEVREAAGRGAGRVPRRHPRRPPGGRRRRAAAAVELLAPAVAGVGGRLDGRRLRRGRRPRRARGRGAASTTRRATTSRSPTTRPVRASASRRARSRPSSRRPRSLRRRRPAAVPALRAADRPRAATPARGSTDGGVSRFPTSRRELLRCGDLTIVGRMPWSSNATFLVEHPRARRRRPIPRRRRRPDAAAPAPCSGPSTSPTAASDRCGTSPTGSTSREVAAYELARGARLGARARRPSLRDGPLGEGSLQRFVDADFEQHYFTLYEDEAYHPQLRRMCAFDLVANSTDRKSGHVPRRRATATSGASTTACPSTPSSSCAR